MSQKKELLIGIPGSLNSDKMFGATGNYMQFANKFGNVRIIMPHEDLVEVDLLILPGGLDLSPSSYGKVPGYQNTNHDVFKEHFYKNKLALYVEAETPIFGICLGFQMLNVFFGGTLTQHIMGHSNSARWQMDHEIILDLSEEQFDGEGKSLGKKKIKVNSHHHQAVVQHKNRDGEVLKTDLSPEMYVIAHCPDSQGEIVEAFAHNTKLVAGVQFHPEEIFGEYLATAIIKNLLKEKAKLMKGK